MVSTDLQTHMVSLSEIVPYAGNAKEHPEWHVDQLVSSIEKFGNCDPIGVWHNQRGQLEVVEGHGRLMALEKLGYEEAPVIFLDHLTDEQRRAYALVHNQLTMNTGFDEEILAAELSKIADIDMSQFDFEISEEDEDGELEPIDVDEDELPEISPTRAKAGQIWALGDHRLVCGDSTDQRVVEALMGGEEADLPAAHKLTVEEASKGGKASGKARRKNREIREMLEEYLAMPAKVNGRMRAVSKRRTRWGLGRRTHKGAQREGGRPLTGTSGSTRA